MYLLQKKRFDGATYNAAGSSYQMQWNVAEGYNTAYQEPGPGTVAIAETMNQVHFVSCLLPLLGLQLSLIVCAAATSLERLMPVCAILSHTCRHFQHSCAGIQGCASCATSFSPALRSI